MFKLIQTALTAFITVLWLNGFSQQRVVVSTFEYIWQKDFSDPKPRVIFPMNDSTKLLIKNSFVQAMQRRWSMDVSDFPVDVKPLPIFSNTPKFKTGIKDKDAASWYLFLQVFDKGNFSFFSKNGGDSLTTTLELKCRIINGSNDSLVLDKNLSVEIYRETPPPDQSLLKRLPSYPAYFVQGFDSIANWLFDTTTVSQYSLLLKPACIYEETGKVNESISPLFFKSDLQDIHLVSGPEFSFHIPAVNYKKLDTKSNIGGNTASGALTLLTGIQTNKKKSYEYLADYSYEEDDSVFHCMVNYIEVETAERLRETTNVNGSKSYSNKSGEYRLLGRYIDTAIMHEIIIDNDTLALFNVTYLPAGGSASQGSVMWDGSDTSTIIAMPKEWNNTEVESDVLLSGKTGGDTFFMKTTRGTRIKDFYINDQLVMTIHGRQLPVKGFAYSPVSILKLKLFTMLASLPYAFFNYSSYQ